MAATTGTRSADGGTDRQRRSFEAVGVAAMPLAIGGVGAALSAESIRTWYRTLDKPPWNPPDGVFGPVWTTLYVAMGLALALVWRLDRSRPDVRLAVALFVVQLGLNLGWSYVFFRRRAIRAALVEILALDASIVATLAAFARLSRPAALLLVPYLVWSTFATVLNAEIARRNG